LTGNSIDFVGECGYFPELHIPDIRLWVDRIWEKEQKLEIRRAWKQYSKDNENISKINMQISWQFLKTFIWTNPVGKLPNKNIMKILVTGSLFCCTWNVVYEFITSILKSLVILAIWLALSSVIYSRHYQGQKQKKIWKNLTVLGWKLWNDSTA